MLIAFFCQNEDGKSLTLHILDSIASFLTPAGMLHMSVDQFFWEKWKDSLS